LRANEILNCSEAKQAICMQILGCTHKEVEKVMLSIIQERKLTEYQKEQLELQKFAPEKFAPEIEQAIKIQEKRRLNCVEFSREECYSLIEESNKSIAQRPHKKQKTEYPVYSLEEVQSLLNEEEQWDSTSLTESDQKTKSKTKRLKRTKN
jgi:hypothetical protein